MSLSMFGLRDAHGRFARLVFHPSEVLMHVYFDAQNTFTIRGEKFCSLALTPVNALELAEQLAAWAATAEAPIPLEQG